MKVVQIYHEWLALFAVARDAEANRAQAKDMPTRGAEEYPLR
ncbi:MAG: hypothetical protein AB8B99_00295 [Phormidesmis sp.]